MENMTREEFKFLQKIFMNGKNVKDGMFNVEALQKQADRLIYGQGANVTPRVSKKKPGEKQYEKEVENNLSTEGANATLRASKKQPGERQCERQVENDLQMEDAPSRKAYRKLALPSESSIVSLPDGTTEREKIDGNHPHQAHISTPDCMESDGRRRRVDEDKLRAKKHRIEKGMEKTTLEEVNGWEKMAETDGNSGKRREKDVDGDSCSLALVEVPHVVRPPKQSWGNFEHLRPVLRAIAQGCLSHAYDARIFPTDMDLRKYLMEATRTEKGSDLERRLLEELCKKGDGSFMAGYWKAIQGVRGELVACIKTTFWEKYGVPLPHKNGEDRFAKERSELREELTKSDEWRVKRGVHYASSAFLAALCKGFNIPHARHPECTLQQLVFCHMVLQFDVQRDGRLSRVPEENRRKMCKIEAEIMELASTPGKNHFYVKVIPADKEMTIGKWVWNFGGMRRGIRIGKEDVPQPNMDFCIEPTTSAVSDGDSGGD